MISVRSIKVEKTWVTIAQGYIVKNNSFKKFRKVSKLSISIKESILILTLSFFKGYQDVGCHNSTFHILLGSLLDISAPARFWSCRYSTPWICKICQNHIYSNGISKQVSGYLFKCLEVVWVISKINFQFKFFTNPKHISFFNIFSALNPLIYGFMSESFRERFQKAVCSCRKLRSGDFRNNSKSYNKHEKGQQNNKGQFCCKHREDHVDHCLNSHGLRVNRSKQSSSLINRCVR